MRDALLLRVRSTQYCLHSQCVLVVQRAVFLETPLAFNNIHTKASHTAKNLPYHSCVSGAIRMRVWCISQFWISSLYLPVFASSRVRLVRCVNGLIFATLMACFSVWSAAAHVSIIGITLGAYAFVHIFNMCGACLWARAARGWWANVWALHNNPCIEAIRSRVCDNLSYDDGPTIMYHARVVCKCFAFYVP